MRMIYFNAYRLRFSLDFYQKNNERVINLSKIRYYELEIHRLHASEIWWR